MSSDVRTKADLLVHPSSITPEMPVPNCACNVRGYAALVKQNPGERPRSGSSYCSTLAQRSLALDCMESPI